MSEAFIRIKDSSDGTIDMDVQFAEEINNDSPAHKVVARFIEFANQSQAESNNQQG